MILESGAYRVGMKEIRERKNMTRQELADSIGVSVRTVGRYETGDRLPDIDRQEKIAFCLGVSVEELGLEKGRKMEKTRSSETNGLGQQYENIQNDENRNKEEKEILGERHGLLCAYRARPDKYHSDTLYFPPCLYESCSAYRRGKCTFREERDEMEDVWWT